MYSIVPNVILQLLLTGLSQVIHFNIMNGTSSGRQSLSNIPTHFSQISDILGQTQALLEQTEFFNQTSSTRSPEKFAFRKRDESPAKSLEPVKLPEFQLTEGFNPFHVGNIKQKPPSATNKFSDISPITHLMKGEIQNLDPTKTSQPLFSKNQHLLSTSFPPDTEESFSTSLNSNFPSSADVFFPSITQSPNDGSTISTLPPFTISHHHPLGLISSTISSPVNILSTIVPKQTPNVLQLLPDVDSMPKQNINTEILNNPFNLDTILAKSQKQLSPLFVSTTQAPFPVTRGTVSTDTFRSTSHGSPPKSVFVNTNFNSLLTTTELPKLSERITNGRQFPSKSRNLSSVKENIVISNGFQRPNCATGTDKYCLSDPFYPR